MTASATVSNTGKFNSLRRVDGDTYLLAFTGHSDDGWLKTFNVPFYLGKFEGNMTINTNNTSNYSKEKIMNQGFHLQSYHYY